MSFAIIKAAQRVADVISMLKHLQEIIGSSSSHMVRMFGLDETANNYNYPYQGGKYTILLQHDVIMMNSFVQGVENSLIEYSTEHNPSSQLKKVCSLTHSVLFLKCDLIQNKLKVEQIVHYWELCTVYNFSVCVCKLFCILCPFPKSSQ